MMAATSAAAVANYFIAAGLNERKPVTHLKLQKLVYIAYGYHLLLDREPLFEEAVEAWELGPVIPSLYHEFKRFGHEVITDRATIFDHQTGQFRTPQVSDEHALTTLRFVWRRYGSLTAYRLVQLTHNPRTPWAKAKKRGKQPIRPSDMKEHYLGILRRARKRARGAPSRFSA